MTVIIEHVLQNLSHYIQDIKKRPPVLDVDISICKGTTATHLYSNESMTRKSKLQSS